MQYFQAKNRYTFGSGTKIDDKFPLAQFCVEGYSSSYRLDKPLEHVKEGSLLLYVRDDIPPKQIKLKLIENEAFEGFFV